MKWNENSKKNEIQKYLVKYSVLLNVFFGAYIILDGKWRIFTNKTEKLYPQTHFTNLLLGNNSRHLHQRNGKLTFHAIFTTSPQSLIDVMDERGGKSKVQGEFSWRHWRCVESVFYHHPNATMIIHSNTLHLSMLDVLRKKGYDAHVQRYKLSELAQGTSAVEFVRDELPYAMERQNWYSHETDLIRLLLLYKYGGIYIDTDVIIVRDWHDLPSNVIGWESSDTLNGAILKFDKPCHPFLQMCIEQFSRHYSQALAENGPLLLSRVYQQWSAVNRSNDVILVNSNVFYMFFYGAIAKECFEVTFGAIYNAKMKILEDDAYAVHLYSKMTGAFGIKGGGEIIKNGTICEYLLSRFCVLCHES
ncbi:lactosylceramide 4-alpha-galactosyltransferase-like [Xenia sp. Carnegie-2017]|uniref:lactosylceramide 4-alpha-galactosyltransferase-like n=1 Tax=Xenia sp. Carnegie-2017 TaxID=2897299 RepID=UPI001F03BDD1|nr:lactosylceramide 4-alpha-galactosyltransferase-like [Xenia sp. Carnegie-2017]XP_046858173.1 lactosylceramide 4-alpha-galactosyltransferase-like [Xenia sp. Carnegie-2017]